MKKYWMCILVFIMLIFSFEVFAMDGEIVPIKITKRETSIAKTLGAKDIFIYNINLSNIKTDSLNFVVWINKYENGKEKEGKLVQLSTSGPKVLFDDTLNLIFAVIDSQYAQPQWMTSFGENNEVNTMTWGQNKEAIKAGQYTYYNWISRINNIKFKKNGTFILAYGIADERQTTKDFSNKKLFDGEKEELNKLTNSYKLVYVLKGKFKNK